MDAQQIALVIRLFGKAIRNDWSELDGRTVRDSLDFIADLLVGRYPEITFEQALHAVDITDQGRWIDR